MAALPVGLFPAIGSAVIHFMWQGAVVGALIALALRVTRKNQPGARCMIAFTGLVLSLAAFAYTFVGYLHANSAVHESADFAYPASGSTPMIALEGPESSTGVAELAAGLWLIGALFMAFRFVRGSFATRRLRTTAVSKPKAEWLRAFDCLRIELGIDRTVRLVASGLADVPMVVGWLSPIVIVPVAAFSALDPAQLRCLLIHELQHIRRHDHIFNAAQALVEVVLFFHPAVWWMSNQVRVEREYCCDDSALKLTGNPKLMAEALTSMEALRLTHPNLVLAANGGPLMKRITRILGLTAKRKSTSFVWQIPAGLMLTGVVAVAGTSSASPVLHSISDASVQSKPTDPVEVNQDKPSLAEKKGVEALLEAKKTSISKLRSYLYKAAAVDFEITEQEMTAAIELIYLEVEAISEKVVEMGLQPRQAVDRQLAKLRAGVAARAKRPKAKQAYSAFVNGLNKSVAAGRLSKEAAKELLGQYTKLKSAAKSKAKAQLEGTKAKLEALRKGGISEDKVADFWASELDRIEVMARLHALELKEKALNGVAKGGASYPKLALGLESLNKTAKELKARLAGTEKALTESPKVHDLWLGEAWERKDLDNESSEYQARIADADKALKAHIGEADKGVVEFARRMKAQVDAGLITEQAAGKAFDERRRARGQYLNEANAQQEYNKLDQAMKARIAAGLISESDAHRELAEYRIAVGPRQSLEQAGAEYRAVKKELAALVKHGMITETQALGRLTLLRRKMSEEQVNAIVAESLSKFAAAEKELEAALQGISSEVKARGLSLEQVKQALDRLRAELAPPSKAKTGLPAE